MTKARVLHIFILLVGIAAITIAIAMYWTGFRYGIGVYWPHSTQPTELYNFFSGIGPILIAPILQLGGFALLWWWHTTCHDIDCWRPGKYSRQDQETGHIIRLCRRHIHSKNTPHLQPK